MADLLAVVPGSRRPIRIDSTGVVVNIAIQRSQHPSFSSNMGTNSSASRRKPPTTYRSPSLQFPGDLCIERSGQYIRRSPSGHGPLPAPSTRSTRASPGHGGAGVPAPNGPTGAKPKYPMKPPLPIYHPLGRLALSLPQLELGLHSQSSSLNQTDDTTRGAASRSRRPAARARDATDTDSVDAATPLTVSADPPAAPEKPSPRRRRNNGQSNSRRRRREADDGDATYPAKRTRANRAPAAVAPSDGGSPGNGGADAADVDGSEEGIKVAPERRSTRSRAAAQAKPPVRRNSSASDRTQTSVSVSIAGGQPRKEHVETTPPYTTVRASAAPSGQSDAVSASKGVAEAEEPAMQIADIGGSAPQAKGPEASIDKDKDAALGGAEAEDPPLGASVVSAPRKPEEGKLDEEGGPRARPSPS